MTTTHNLSLPSPPFFNVPNINNLRDAALASGGLKTPSGRIRPGILFRSAEVSKLDREGWKAVHQIGVGHVFDLRSKPEVEKGWKGVTMEKEKEGDESDVKKGWEEGMREAGVERSWCPVFDETDYSPERLAERYMKYMDESEEGFVQAYHDILVHAGPAFGTIFRYLSALPPAGQEDGKKLGALIHCTAGKDRTGIFFGILFSFLGVAKEAIADEYHLTELGLGHHIRDEFVGRLMQSPGFKKYVVAQMEGRQVSVDEIHAALVEAGEQEKGSADAQQQQVIPPEIIEKGKQAALRMIGARKESMLGALSMVEKEWGSAEGYLREFIGLGDKELEGLRKGLVVGGD